MNSETIKRPSIATVLYIIGAILVLIGIILCIRVAFVNAEREELKKTYVECEAVVDTVKTTFGTRNRKTFVWAHYTVGDITYKNARINDYPLGVHEGDKIKIYYDPQRPHIYVEESGLRITLATDLIGTYILFFGIVLIFLGSKMYKDPAEIKLEKRFKKFGPDYDKNASDETGSPPNADVLSYYKSPETYTDHFAGNYNNNSDNYYYSKRH